MKRSDLDRVNRARAAFPNKYNDFGDEEILNDLNCIRNEKVRIDRNIRARENRINMKAAYDSVGMVRVRGNNGGTYWE